MRRRIALLALGAALVACGAPPGAGPADADGGGVDAEPAAEVAPADAPGGPDAAGPCEEGALACLDEDTVGRCQDGALLPSQQCAGDQVCFEGACAEAGPCAPGAADGCATLGAERVCDPTGAAWIARDCPPGQLCVGGACAIAVCVPGETECRGDGKVAACAADGSGWGLPAPCPDDGICVAGKCVDPCSGDVKFNDSYVGCSFYSVDLGQWDPKPGESQLEPSAAVIPHAVVVGNPGATIANVTFSVTDGTPMTVTGAAVAPGQTRSFLMPVLSQQESGVTGQSIAIRSTRPITAAQFNPANNAAKVASNDASLLLPDTVLGKEYYALTLASVEGLTLPGLGKMPSVYGFLTVVAAAPGTTSVTVTPTAPVLAGPGFDARPAGVPFTVELAQGDVLNLNSEPPPGLAAGLDLSGTRVEASARVAVFAGHQCMVVGDSNCDHLETSLLPVSAWGKAYVAGRLQTPAPNVYRVVSASDGNVLTTTPPVPELAGKTLDRGEWAEATTDQSFRLSATAPVQVVQLIAGNSGGSAGFDVDPSMTLLIPEVQYRTDYPILVPDAYGTDLLCVTRKTGSPVRLDGVPLAANAFAPIGSTGWEVANVDVADGLVHVTGDAPFGLIAYGYDQKVSYAYPAGLSATPQP